MTTLERHIIQQTSVPKMQKADIVCIHANLNKERAKKYRSTSTKIGAADRNKWSWKPRTKFEQTYFGDLDNYEGRSKEFQSSRERLHEIFEHNRYLRRKFFADMPGASVPSSNLKLASNNAGGLGFGSTETVNSQSNQSAESSNDRKSQNEFSETPDVGVDKESAESCEGLSSNFETKSRNLMVETKCASSEPTESESRKLLNLFNSKTEDYKYSQFEADSCESLMDNENTKSMVTDIVYRSRKGRLFNNQMRKSLPNLGKLDSKYSIAKIAINGYAYDMTDSVKSMDNFFTYRFMNPRTSGFNSVDTSDAESNESIYRTIQPSSDLDERVHSQASTANKCYQLSENENCKSKKNSTVEVSLLQNYDKPRTSEVAIIDSDNEDAELRRNRESFLRSSQSLLELSTSPPSTRVRRLKNICRGRSSLLRGFHKSCSDLSTQQELRSPKLVNKFKNSLTDLRRCNSLMSTCDQISPLRLYSDDSRSSSGTCSPLMGHNKSRSGTTLTSVYGPIPFKSPRRYVEGEVTIHYRSPVRTEAKEPLSEEELARRSAESMRRVYQEERRRKYLQELHDIDSRRHTDNFIPSQKSPIPLNRYDDFIDDLSYRSRSQDQTPEPRLVARALYNFVGQSPRELTFRRGDLIFVRRQVDKNWYEGEHNAMVGLFPFNYVEIIPYDGMRTTPKKPYEGQARAKFNFIAQTHLELSLAKGELVVLTRRVDENWYEGRIGNKKGIFPTSYVEVLAEPGNRPETPVQSKPVASPAAHSLLSNGSSGGKLSMGPHHYTPILPNTNMSQSHYNSLPRCAGNKLQVAPVNETLHIDTHSEPIPYRVLYNYRPQNEDELELKEGDTVYVMEKCDDGWYVGSSQRTGYFGTFPGNYVERL